MTNVKICLSKNDKQIEYYFDLDEQTYRSSSTIINDNGEHITEISEEGEIGNDANRLMMAKRIYYVLLETLKHRG